MAGHRPVEDHLTGQDPVEKDLSATGDLEVVLQVEDEVVVGPALDRQFSARDPESGGHFDHVDAAVAGDGEVDCVDAREGLRRRQRREGGRGGEGVGDGTAQVRVRVEAAVDGGGAGESDYHSRRRVYVAG